MAHDENARRDPDSAAHNPPHEDDVLERRIADQPGIDPAGWVKRAVLVLVLIVAAFVVWKISAAFFPRWWGQRVGEQVQGRFIAGTSWGLFYGFVFTFVPLLLLFQVRRRFLSWTWRGILAVVAIVLAAPNWLTLAVVAGNSKAAHAGERIMDVDAPNFRAATLIGVVVGGLLAFVVSGTAIALKRRKNEVKKLKGERREWRSRDHEAEQQ